MVELTSKKKKKIKAFGRIEMNERKDQRGMMWLGSRAGAVSPTINPNREEEEEEEDEEQA